MPMTMTALSASTHRIDPYLFEKHVDAFVKFVEGKSGKQFESFAANPFIPLYDALEDEEACRQVEACLFRLYRDRDIGKAFEDLVEIVGRNYPLLAYLLFLKDRTRFLPIAPRTFDRSFSYLGIDFSASGNCSWVNYQEYNRILLELQGLLSEQLDCRVEPLDAHSFAWIIARQMQTEGALPDVQDYAKLGPTERDAVVKARIGQGRFRDELMKYWDTCAVTGVTDRSLLRASHIIPWSKASIEDLTNPFNGLLLAVHIDALFEVGLISFADSGEIIISPALSEADADALGVHKGMRLRSVDERHMARLEYHRSQRFRDAKPDSPRGGCR